MEYSIQKLSHMAGLTTRTLRYYDQIQLLPPLRVSSGGYRIYGQKEVDRLQQILFYRELGVPLEEIKTILNASDYDENAALQKHLHALLMKRTQLDALIANVQKSVAAKKGEMIMTDSEKFEGFKQQLLEENEQKYGREIRENYGEESIFQSNEKFKNMSQGEFSALEKLSAKLNEALKQAFANGDPAAPLAQEVCRLHKDWLCHFWNTYSEEAHIGVTQMYVDDPRFTAYYDKIAVGCAAFLRDAVLIFCGRR